MAIDTGLDLTYNASFPLPGVDNDSQGFRDNFDITKRAIENIHSATSTAASVLNFGQTVGSGGAVRVTLTFPGNSFTLPLGAADAPATGMIRTSSASQLPQYYYQTAWHDIATYLPTGAMALPVGSSVTRPNPPVEGSIRYNSQIKALEFYNGSVWVGAGNTGTAEVQQLVDQANSIIANGITTINAGLADISNAVSNVNVLQGFIDSEVANAIANINLYLNSASDAANIAVENATLAANFAGAANTYAEQSNLQAVYAAANAALAYEERVLVAGYVANVANVGQEANWAVANAVIATQQAAYATENAAIAFSNATLAAGYANIAADNAVISAANASIATEKAAFAAANAALAYEERLLVAGYVANIANIGEEANWAVANATIATEQATYATANAALAFSNAQLAAGFASAAEANATISTQQATYATANASIASSNAVLSSGFASNAANSATTAAANATIATQQATFASANATIAISNATLAAGFAGNAANSASIAAANASVATQQAAFATANASVAVSNAVLAAGFASNAANSASVASSNATIAIERAAYATANASAAQSNAVLAAGHAANAASNATVATQQAAFASANASMAFSNATLAATYATSAASIASQSINRNSVFSKDWTSGTIPPDWVNWADATINTKETGNVSVYAIQFNMLNGQSNTGLLQNSSSSPALGTTTAGWYVMEAEVTLVAGSLVGSGLRMEGYTSANVNTENFNLAFDSDPDISGNTVGAGVVGRTYRFSKLVRYVNTNTIKTNFYLLARWTGFSSTTLPTTLKFHKAILRAADAGEIELGTARSSAATLSARFTEVTNAIATANSATAQRVTILEATRSSTANLLGRTTFSAATGGTSSWNTFTNDTNGGYTFYVHTGTDWSLTGEPALATFQSDEQTGFVYDWNTIVYNIEPGRRYCASVYSGSHRADLEIFIEFFDSTGTFLGASWNNALPGFASDRVNALEKQGGNTLSSFKRIWTMGTAPANSYRATVALRKHPTKAGQGNSYGFFVRPMLAIVSDTATSPPDFVGANVESRVVTSESAIAGLSAQAGVTVTAQGHIAGWQAYAGSSGSTFYILANKFGIVDPNNVNSVTNPFEVIGGVTYIANASIRVLQVEKITGGNYANVMNVGSGGNVVIDGTAGRIIIKDNS